MPPCQQNSFFDSQFSLPEFHSALGPKKVKSAPGIDGIDFDILKKLPVKYEILLLDIFNRMYKDNDYPPSWKHSFIHFIGKSDGVGLRLISLTSCLCKLFETLIKNRLLWWAEYNNIVPRNQHGFRNGKSCLDNLTILALKVDEAFAEKKRSWPHSSMFRVHLIMSVLTPYFPNSRRWMFIQDTDVYKIPDS